MFAAGKKAPLIVAPTGSGKSIQLLHYADYHLKTGGKRVVILAPRREIVSQFHTTGTNMGLPMGSDILVATNQWALNGLPEHTLLLLDEARHICSNEWSSTLSKAPRIGCDATPERQDGVGLGNAFDCIVVSATVKELTAQGILVPVDVIAPRKPLRSNQIASRPVDAYNEHAQGKKAIVFAQQIDAANQYVEEFGAIARVVVGTTANREQILEDFQEGRIKVLVSVMVLTEGFDCPSADVAIIARRCGSRSMYLQIAGRVMRSAVGKDRGLLLDLVGASCIHGLPDQEIAYSLTGRGLGSAISTDRYCSVCGAPEPKAQCDFCGYKPDPLAMPSVKKVKLERKIYIPIATDEEKIAKLSELIKLGWQRKYNPKAAFVKFSVLYGAYPSGAQIYQATKKAKSCKPD